MTKVRELPCELLPYAVSQDRISFSLTNSQANLLATFQPADVVCGSTVDRPVCGYSLRMWSVDVPSTVQSADIVCGCGLWMYRRLSSLRI
jgi:hypothetical protein